MSFERIKSWAKKNGPTICTIGACIGTCVNVVYSVSAGMNTQTHLEEIRDANAEYMWDHRDEYDVITPTTNINDLWEYAKPTTKQIVKACWKDYIPVFITTIFTMICAVGSDALNKRNQAAISAAYFALKKYASELQRTMSNNGINSIEVSDELLHENLDDFVAEDDEKHLFYYIYVNDDIGNTDGQYFESTIRDVVLSEYHINRNFILKGSMTVNETLDWFNLKREKHGDKIGWDICNDTGYQWIDFHHEKVELDDGMECYIISSDFDAAVFSDEYAY